MAASQPQYIRLHEVLVREMSKDGTVQTHYVIEKSRQIDALRLFMHQYVDDKDVFAIDCTFKVTDLVVEDEHGDLYTLPSKNWAHYWYRLDPYFPTNWLTVPSFYVCKPLSVEQQQRYLKTLSYEKLHKVWAAWPFRTMCQFYRP